MRKAKKTIYTLNLNGHEPEVSAVTFPLMERYAEKIGAGFYIIKDRKFPDKYPTYEKFQVFDLSKEHQNDWNIFFDSDTLIHPDFFDITDCMNKDTTCSGYVSDFTPQRFRSDECFLRDGRFFGKGTWFIVNSDWCRDIWEPLDDITYEQAVSNIFPTVDEVKKIGKTKESMIDDYVVSRNIARYGLKHIHITDIQGVHKFPNVRIAQNEATPLLLHDYNLDPNAKIIWMHKMLKAWGVE